MMKYKLTIYSEKIGDLESICKAIKKQPEAREHEPIVDPVIQKPAIVKMLKDPDTGEVHTVNQMNDNQRVVATNQKRRICENCQMPFIPKRSDSHYCSKRCGNIDYQRKYYKKKHGIGNNPSDTTVVKALSQENFRIFEINGKKTQVFGTSEQLENFEKRYYKQDEERKKQLKKAKPARVEDTIETEGE